MKLFTSTLIRLLLTPFTLLLCTKVGVRKHGIMVEIDLQARRPLFMSDLTTKLNNVGLSAHEISNLQFSAIRNSADLLSLPTEFFKDHLTEDQLVQIVKNEDLRSLFGTEMKWKESVTLKDEIKLMKAKVEIIASKLGCITREKVGSIFDTLLLDIRTSYYKYLDPVSALTSVNFKGSNKRIAKLFGVSRHSLGEVIKKAIRDMTKVPKETLLAGITNIAFELMLRGVPMPSFFTRRIASLVTGISAKSALTIKNSTLMKIDSNVMNQEADANDCVVLDEFRSVTRSIIKLIDKVKKDNWSCLGILSSNNNAADLHNLSKLILLNLRILDPILLYSDKILTDQMKACPAESLHLKRHFEWSLYHLTEATKGIDAMVKEISSINDEEWDESILNITRNFLIYTAESVVNTHLSDAHSFLFEQMAAMIALSKKSNHLQSKSLSNTLDFSEVTSLGDQENSPVFIENALRTMGKIVSSLSANEDIVSQKD